MFSLAVLLSLCFVSTIFATNDNRLRVIFGVRCEARCFAKNQEKATPCNGTCFQACNMPCNDTEFYKVKSCTVYCRKWVNYKFNKECKSSCKLLMRLYNTGGGSKKKQLSDKLPNRPAALNSMLIRRKKQHKMVVKWSYNSRANSQARPLFIVETRYYKENPFFMSHWEFLQKTNTTSIQITPTPNAWSEYRVMSVNEYGTSDYSSPSPPVYVMPDRPSTPRDFRVVEMIRRKDKVSVHLAWSKPLKTEVPVHRYRLYWSPRLDKHTKKIHSLRVHHEKVKGGVHVYYLNGLNINTTYVFELQAICHFKGQRLRSKRVILRTRTLDKAEKPKLLKKKKKMKKKVVQNSNNNKRVKIQATESSYKGVISTLVTKRMPTKGLNITIQGLKSHNGAERDTIRVWLYFVAIAIAFVLQC